MPPTPTMRMDPAARRAGARFLHGVLLGGLFLLFFLLLAHSASASISGGTCSQAITNTGADGNQRSWSVLPNSKTNPSTPDGCDFGGVGSPATISEVNSGSSLLLKCFENNGGTVPPVESTSVVVKGFQDNDNFGVTTATPIWTWNVGATCLGTPTFSAFCTSDGTNLGSPSYGIVRIQVHASAIVSAVTVYDVNSEGADPSPTGTQDVGIYRCDPAVSVLDTGASPQNPWIGGDTVTMRAAVDSTSYNTGNTGDLFVRCGSHDSVPTNARLGTSSTTQATIIQGSPQLWVSGCSLSAAQELTRTSTVTGYTSTLYAIYDQASPPSGVTFPTSTLALFTGNTLNRALTASLSCTVQVQSTSVTIVMRLQTVTVDDCGWKDARGNFIPNNQAARGWVQRNTDYRVTTDFPSTDALWASSNGKLTTSHTATPTATTSTGLSYHKMAEEFADTTRTDLVLWNWGNSSGQLDVSSTATLTCHLLDPVDLVTTDITALNPGESSLCRSTSLVGANSLGVQSTFLRVAYRRSTQPSLSSVDLATCDVSTNATGTGGWACDSSVKNTAVKSTGQLYIVEACTFLDSGRTQQAYCATTAAKFDVVATASVTCTLRSPVTFAALPASGLYNPGEIVPCRDGVFTNARGEGIKNSFLRVNYRRSTQASGDTTDITSCDVTSNATGGTWKCDGQARPTGAGDAVRATLTTGQAYIVEVRVFSDSSRTLFLVGANSTTDFDIVPDYTVDCGLQDPVSLADPVLFVQRGNAAKCPAFASNATNARGEQEPAGAFFTVYYRRATQPDRSVTDFAQCNHTSVTLGVWGPCDVTASSTSTATTGQAYIVEVAKWIDSGHTRLMVEANTSGLFDVSATWTLDGINMSRSSLGANASSFTIGTDIEFARSRGLRDANLNLVSGKAVSCIRTRPDATQESATAMGNTDTNGNSPEVQFQVFAPQGLWLMDCSSSSGGNSGTYHIGFFHASAFTANTDITISVLSTVNQSAVDWYDVNVTVVVRTFDPSQDGPIRTFVDDVLKVSIFSRDGGGGYLTTPIYRMQAAQIEVTDSAYTVLFSAHSADLTPAFVYATANITGRAFENGASYTLATNSIITPTAALLLADMASFFSLPTMILLPYFALIIGSIVLMGVVKGFFPNFVLLMVNFLSLFSLAGSKAQIDVLGSVFTPILVILELALILLGIVWCFREGTRNGMFAHADEGREGG